MVNLRIEGWRLRRLRNRDPVECRNWTTPTQLPEVCTDAEIYESILRRHDKAVRKPL
jgi:hypothetical protein